MPLPFLHKKKKKKSKGSKEGSSESTDKYSAKLLRAASSGSHVAVKKLLDKSAAINCTDQEGCTPLMVAAREGHYSTCKVLLRYHADVSVHDHSGDTALHHASRAGHLDICRLLYVYDADPNADGMEELTPFQSVLAFTPHVNGEIVTFLRQISKGGLPKPHVAEQLGMRELAHHMRQGHSLSKYRLPTLDELEASMHEDDEKSRRKSHPTVAMHREQVHAVREVTVRKHKTFGFSFVTLENEAYPGELHVVNTILDDCDYVGDLRQMDFIVKVNGVDVTSKLHREVMNIICGAEKELELLVQNTEPAFSGRPAKRMAVLQRREGSGSFGIAIATTGDPSVDTQHQIMWLTDDLLQSTGDKLRVGDVILAIDDVDVASFDHTAILEKIKGCKQSLHLTVVKGTLQSGLSSTLFSSSSSQNPRASTNSSTSSTSNSQQTRAGSSRVQRLLPAPPYTQNGPALGARSLQDRRKDLLTEAV